MKNVRHRQPASIRLSAGWIGNGMLWWIIGLLAVSILGIWLVLYWVDTPVSTDSTARSMASGSEVVSNKAVAISALPADFQQASGSVDPQMRTGQPVEHVQSYPDAQGSFQRATSASVAGADTLSSAMKAATNLSTALSVGDPPASAETDVAADPIVDDEPQAQSSIAGWVLNQTGEPVPGIQVTATAQRLFQESEAEVLRGTGASQETRSDNEGRYAFHQLADGEYEIRTQATALYLAARIIVRTGVDSADLILQGEYEFGIYGTVESTEGPLLEGVRVIPIGQAARETSTTGDGSYALTVATIGQRETTALRLLLEGYREHRLVVRNIDAAATGSIRLDARLEPSTGFAVVSGGLINSNHQPVSGATLLLSSARLNRHYNARSDYSGLFLFPEVEMGDDYRLRAIATDSYREYVQQDLIIAGDDNDLLIVLERRGSGRLEGWMSDPEGNPVAGFSLWLRNEDLPGLQPRLVTGDTKGYFAVDEVLAGELTFATRAEPSMRISGIQLQPDDKLKLQLIVDWGDHALYGQVLDSSGGPVSQAKLSLSWSDSRGGLFSRSIRNATSDSEGYFLFTRVGIGLHQLRISAQDFRNAELSYAVGVATEDVLVMLEPEN